MYTTTRLKQTIGRTVRPANTNKKVHIQFITNGLNGILKTIYGIVYSFNYWEGPYDESPSSDLLIKTYQMMKILGYNNITNINMVDYCVLFNKYLPYLKLIEWWEKYKTVDTKLTKEMIENMNTY